MPLFFVCDMYIIWWIEQLTVDCGILFISRFRPVDNSPEKVVSPLIHSKNRNHPPPPQSESSRGDPAEVHLESPFSDVFSDSGDESETGR